MNNNLMEVQKFIKEKGWDALNIELGIAVKEYEKEGLVMLNYSQIESPKTHPVVIECRSLILDKATTNVISRSFDRFFNYGEAWEETGKVDFKRALISEKCDGSLIKIYYCKNTGRWEIATRKQAFGEIVHDTTGLTYRDEIILNVGFFNETWFQKISDFMFDTEYTYIFEYIGPDNKIVTNYSHSELVILSARQNIYPYSELSLDKLNYLCSLFNGTTIFGNFKIRMPEYYDISDEASDIIATANELDGLKEGFVVYDPVSGKRCKIKSATYVAIHNIRDNGATSVKKIAELVLINDYDEYLTYFPEDIEKFKPYIDTYNTILQQLDIEYEKVKNIISQKEFALAINGLIYSGVFFAARKLNIPASTAFNNAKLDFKIELLLNWLK